MNRSAKVAPPNRWTARRRRFCAVLVAFPLLAVPAGAGQAAATSDGVVAAAVADTVSNQANERLQAVLDELVVNGAPGVVALVNDGTTTTQLASGVRKAGAADPLRPDARFRVGSVTKTFIATLMLQLEQQGRVGLGDSVERWLPGLVPNGDQITVRMLLNHTSGVFSYTDDPEFVAGLAENPLRHRTPEELVSSAARHPPVFAPGTSWSYSNTNYVLAGMILRAAGRAPLAVQLNWRVLRPLGLHETGFPAGPRIGGYFAHGHLPADNPFVPSPNDQPVDITAISPSIAWAAGGMTSTTGDLARFYSALLGGRLLAPEQLRELKQLVQIDPTVGYGLGLTHQRTACGDIWGHGGSIPGYETLAFADETGRRQVVLAMTINPDQNTGPLLGLAADSAVCQMFGRLPLNPSAALAPLQSLPGQAAGRSATFLS